MAGHLTLDQATLVRPQLREPDVRAPIAQQAERSPRKGEVIGSIPFRGSGSSTGILAGHRLRQTQKPRPAEVIVVMLVRVVEQVDAPA